MHQTNFTITAPHPWEIVGNCTSFLPEKKKKKKPAISIQAVECLRMSAMVCGGI